MARESGITGRTPRKDSAEWKPNDCPRSKEALDLERSVQEAVDAAGSFHAEAAASSSGEPYPQDGEQRSRGNSEVDSELEECENGLRQEVPGLLETMNRSSQEVNSLERQAEQTSKRYRQLLAESGKLQQDTRTKYGGVIDKARPYFDAGQALSTASNNVQAAVKEFSVASSQHTQAKQELRVFEERLAYGAHKVTLDRDQQNGLSAATVRVLKCQEERDTSEQEYVKALREFQEAQERAEAQRAQVGDAVIRRALPGFRPLQQHQRELERMQKSMADLDERIKVTKNLYRSSLHGLDRINVAMHNARRDFLDRKSLSPKDRTKSSIEPPADAQQSPSEDDRSPEKEDRSSASVSLPEPATGYPPEPSELAMSPAVAEHLTLAGDEAPLAASGAALLADSAVPPGSEQPPGSQRADREEQAPLVAPESALLAEPAASPGAEIIPAAGG